MEEQKATPSNCGKPLKPLIPTCLETEQRPRITNLDKVKSQRMEQWAIRSQVLKRKAMDAVQRLNVGGQRRKPMHKIKSGPVENTASKRKSQMLYPNAIESFEED
jgi:hypothetical protein